MATASANHANVYYYLKYPIEKAPLIPQTGGETLLDDLMSWSETYRKYEQEQAAQDAMKKVLTVQHKNCLPCGEKTRYRAGGKQIFTAAVRTFFLCSK